MHASVNPKIDKSNSTQAMTRAASRIASPVIKGVLLTICSILFITPFLSMIGTSLKDDQSLFSNPLNFIPNPIEWHYYPDALQSFPFISDLLNSLHITIPNVVGTVVSCSLVAYGFSRIKWPGRNIVFMIMLSTMMIPYQVYMTPLFILFKQFGWVGSLKPLFVPSFFATDAFSVFLIRQFFMSLPKELSDAAKIDGCSEFRTFINVIIPLAKPALFVVALFTFLNNWNDYLGPLIYLQDPSQFTLQLGLATFQGSHGTAWQMLMAVSTIIVLPVIVVFLIGQRTFVQGITLGGVKE